MTNFQHCYTDSPAIDLHPGLPNGPTRKGGLLIDAGCNLKAYGPFGLEVERQGQGKCFFPCGFDACSPQWLASVGCDSSRPV